MIATPTGDSSRQIVDFSPTWLRVREGEWSGSAPLYRHVTHPFSRWTIIQDWYA
jgi:hypothetical protein